MSIKYSLNNHLVVKRVYDPKDDNPYSERFTNFSDLAPQLVRDLRYHHAVTLKLPLPVAIDFMRGAITSTPDPNIFSMTVAFVDFLEDNSFEEEDAHSSRPIDSTNFGAEELQRQKDKRKRDRSMDSDAVVGSFFGDKYFQRHFKQYILINSHTAICQGCTSHSDCGKIWLKPHINLENEFKWHIKYGKRFHFPRLQYCLQYLISDAYVRFAFDQCREHANAKRRKYVTVLPNTETNEFFIKIGFKGEQ
jgi:hypothetical protein